MARKFNMKLAKLEDHVPIPRVDFLNGSVYTCTDEQGKAAAFLVEAYIDSERYRKWNDNASRVDCIASACAARARTHIADPAWAIEDPDPPSHGPSECAQGVGPAFADCIDDLDALESASLEEFDEDNETAVACLPGSVASTSSRVLDPDVPQSFTHFTHRYSRRRLMVCDIQGVLDRSAPAEPVYRLTDPCIHYVSTRGRRMVHGRTDKGWQGMRDFFKTHACNSLCHLLGLAPK
jgi:hypothetical protein